MGEKALAHQDLWCLTRWVCVHGGINPEVSKHVAFLVFGPTSASPSVLLQAYAREIASI